MAGDRGASTSTIGFAVVRKGYDQTQVEAHLRRLDADVRILTTDRDAALDQAAQLGRELEESRVRADRLRAQVRTLVRPEQSVQSMSERMRAMLRLAEDEVAEMLGGAEAEADRRVREAERKAEEILGAARNEVATVQLAVRADTESAEREREQLRAALEADRRAAAQAIAAANAAAEQDRNRLRGELEAEHRARAEALATAAAEAEQARARAWSESEARRALVEEDFTIAMDQRRKEALTALVAEQESTRRETTRLRESATAESRTVIEGARSTADRMIDDARRQVAGLMALRGRLIEQLDTARAQLADTMGDLSRPVAGETAPAAAATADTAPRGNGAAGCDSWTPTADDDVPEQVRRTPSPVRR